MNGNIVKLGCIILVGIFLLVSYIQELPDLAGSSRHERHAGHVRSHQLNLAEGLDFKMPSDDPVAAGSNGGTTPAPPVLTLGGETPSPR